MANNYEITKKRVWALFPNYDHAAMAEKFALKIDDAFLYITMLGRRFRLDRSRGVAEWTDDGMIWSEAGFNEVLTIMDVLCDSASGCALSGQFCSVNDLDGVVVGSKLGDDFFSDSAKVFDRDIPAFRRACEQVGGKKLPQGDASYELPLFSFLPVRLMLWESDDEFPVSMKLLFDRNMLQFMKYETTYYAMGYMLSRLKDLMP